MANIILSEEEYNELKKDRDNWRDWFYELRYALRKDEQLDESISCVRDIPSDVEMIEDLKKRAADSDYYKEKSELLEESRNAANRTSDLWKERCYKREEELKKANELADSWERHYEETLEQFVYPLCDIVYPNISNADINMTGLLEDVKHLKVYAADSDHYNELAESWKRDYERLRDKIIYPIYNILYPDKMDLDINVTDFINNIKDLKIYSEENGQMYKEIQEWREKCIARDIDVDRLLKESKNKDKKISELESRVNYWSNKTTKRANERWEAEKDREECEKKYRDEISKLQNIVSEKEVEIRGLKTEIIRRGFDYIENKNKLKQTISDQEVTIKALLLTIKEMCKEENENA